MGNPSVSIALCTYNGARFLPAQLRSILHQVRLPDELIICDDHSSDATLAIIEDFSRSAPFPVKVRQNPANLGITKNFEQAINLCTGELIMLCDQDDVWHSDKIVVLEKAFGTAPDRALVFSDARIIDQAGVFTGRYLWQTQGIAGAVRARVDQGDLFNVLLACPRVTGATMALRASLKNKIMPIPQAWLHDEWIALLASVFGSYVLIDQPLVDYRRHAEQEVGTPATGITEKAKLVAKPHCVRSAHYSDMAAKFNMAQERLLQSQQDGYHPQRLSALRSKISHMDELSNLPWDRWQRAPLILREVLNGRYLRYSTGWITVAKDLLL